MRGECPEPRPDCKYATCGGCFSDVHHLFFPKNEYRGTIAKEFRELPENKEILCRREHDERHATEPAPTKPTVKEMLATIAFSRVARLKK